MVGVQVMPDSLLCNLSALPCRTFAVLSKAPVLAVDAYRSAELEVKRETNPFCKSEN